MGGDLRNQHAEIISIESIRSCIYSIRGKQVMLDDDLAEIYGTEVKRLNEQVKRNIERFPEHFRFQLTETELVDLRSQIATSKDSTQLKSQIATSKGRGGRRYLPYVFTEQGVSMLSAVLRSDTAVKVSINIMDAFVQMRRFIQNNANVFARLDKVEKSQLEFQNKTEEKFEKVFQALESAEPPSKGIFFNGQIFDAYIFVTALVRKAKKSLVLIDNYVDDTVLTIFSKRKKHVSALIYTRAISKQLALDVEKHNQQYPPIKLEQFNNAHDRFLIIDDTDVYHVGASLKDLGKKWFAFSKFDSGAMEMLQKLGEKS